MRLTSAAGVVALALLGTVVLLSWRRDPAREEPRRSPPIVTPGEIAPLPSSGPSAPEEKPQVSRVSTSEHAENHPSDSAPHDEEAIMHRLHELGEASPLQSLQLAREGNARFPQGPGAAERGWIICKALTNLERFDEARQEAKVMVKQFSGTSWAMDVTAHILIHPGTHPSERGFGKKYELE